MENEAEKKVRDHIIATIMRRGIKNVQDYLVWLREQKTQKVDANKARARTAQYEVDVISKMIEEEKEDK